MAISIKSQREIELMRAAGRIVGQVLDILEKEAVPGVTTSHLAKIADEIIEDAGAIALFRGVKNPPYINFPSCICASVNEQVVHGIPGDRVLKEGDIISVDCGSRLKGYCGDAARTYRIGNVDPEVDKLLRVTEEVLAIAVNESKPGIYWSEIASKMQKHAEKSGYGVVREYVGHGIGRQMHEDPKVPNYSSRELKRSDLLLRKGMVLAIEPMVNMGTHRVKTLSDGWTVVTTDGKPSAHYEHSVAITDNGSDVLTLAE